MKPYIALLRIFVRQLLLIKVIAFQNTAVNEYMFSQCQPYDVPMYMLDMLSISEMKTCYAIEHNLSKCVPLCKHGIIRGPEADVDKHIP